MFCGIINKVKRHTGLPNTSTSKYVWCTKKVILNSMKLSTQKADGARLKDTCATLGPSSFMCAHTMITILSYCSKPRVIFLVQIHPIQCTRSWAVCSMSKMIFSIYSAIHHMAIDFPPVTYSTPALRESVQISSRVYVYHYMHTVKRTSIIFISTISLWKKEQELSSFHTWGIEV